MSYCKISSQINVQDCKYLKYIIKQIYLRVHAVQLSIMKVAVASNFHLPAIVVENNNTWKLVTTKAKNIFDEIFFDKFSYAIQRFACSNVKR